VDVCVVVIVLVDDVESEVVEVVVSVEVTVVVDEVDCVDVDVEVKVVEDVEETVEVPEELWVDVAVLESVEVSVDVTEVVVVVSPTIEVTCKADVFTNGLNGLPDKSDPKPDVSVRKREFVVRKMG
jgi:hypothetical protein